RLNPFLHRGPAPLQPGEPNGDGSFAPCFMSTCGHVRVALTLLRVVLPDQLDLARVRGFVFGQYRTLNLVGFRAPWGLIVVELDDEDLGQAGRHHDWRAHLRLEPEVEVGRVVCERGCRRRRRLPDTSAKE